MSLTIHLFIIKIKSLNMKFYYSFIFLHPFYPADYHLLMYHHLKMTNASLEKMRTQMTSSFLI